MSKVTVTELEKRFSVYGKKGAIIAVDHINFIAESGKITTLLGPSGCGKTTTLRCIAGLEKPDSGEISIGDKIVYSSSKNIFIPPEKRNVGMVFQSYAIWPHMTVFDNIAYPLKIRKLPKKEIEEKVKNVLKLVKMEGFEKRLAPHLSGGQQQRVALARALVYEPDVLLLDEPLSNLDAKLREYMRIELKELQRKLGITTIYVTHDQLEALTLSDKLIVMNEGKIIEQGTPKEIYTRPKSKFTAEFIGLVNFLHGKVTGVDTVETDIGTIYCHIPSDVNSGDSVILCIRPENVRVHKRLLPAEKNVFKAKAKSIIFAGEVLDSYFLVDNSDRVIRAHLHPTSDINEGDDVYLYFDPDLCSIIKVE